MKTLPRIAGIASFVLAATALSAESADLQPLPEVLVIGATPVPGLNIDADKIPGNVQTLSAAALRSDGTADLIKGMSARLGSVNINDTLADAFQPDILYRGFEASPLLGTPQGLAVYQNGVRINEAFGDTVNWDLFPDIAIERIDIVSANPLFGLNALGGALSVTMKSGFSFQGADGDASGGSFNERQAALEFGANNGTLGFYGAARILDQDGWRLFSHDSVRQLYLDGSLRNDGVSIDLSCTRADNQLFGQGAAPAQSLAISTQNVFTGPQHNLNHLNFVTLDSNFKLADGLGLQVVLYSRNFRQTVANGDSSDYTACTSVDNDGELCQGDGATPLTDASGAFIPDISLGGSLGIGQNDFERIRSDGFGGSLQLTSTASILRHVNSVAAGATFDTAQTNFYSGTEVGLLDASLTVLPGVFVSTPEGTDFSATPVNLNANNKYYGFYVTDTFDVTTLLSATFSARYNVAKVDLTDQIGTALSGNNRFTHFNPAIGATYKVLPSVTAFLGYATNNRAPTASEIECSDPTQPCLLPSNLAGDPPNLRQVIAHTTELGARGRWSLAGGTGHLSGSVSVFRTHSDDDIYGIATSVSTGFFQNIGSTRRQGFEAAMNYQSDSLSLYAQYSYIDATFQSPLLLNSPSNPFQDANGNIQVLPGDHLPLIPMNRLKLGADFSPLPHWLIGASMVLASASFYRGDESNQNPQLPGYHPLSLRTSYQVTRHFQLFANAQNLFDERYSTYGLYSDPTGVGAPGVPPNADSNDPSVDNRFQSPAMPRAFFGGAKFSF